LNLPKKVPARSFVLVSALSFLVFQLNVFFAWTSHVGAAVAKGSTYLASSSPLRFFLVTEVNDFVRLQFGVPGLSSFLTKLAAADETSLYARAVSSGTGFLFLGSPNSLATSDFIDIEVALFTAAVFVISLSLFRKTGIGVSVVRAFEVTSLSVLPLGLETFFFDRPEFNLHASDIQAQTGLGWFTNADVLLVSSTILGIAAFVELTRHARGRSAGSPPAGSNPPARF